MSYAAQILCIQRLIIGCHRVIAAPKASALQQAKRLLCT